MPVGDGLYRLRLEGEFKRIIRRGDGWEVIDRGGRHFILGMHPEARIEDKHGDFTRTYSWFIETANDRNGNSVNYTYRRDQDQLYVELITYGPYEIRFEYGERRDAITERRSGFPITTRLRCVGIQYRLPGGTAPLFSNYLLTYEECPYSSLSLLSSISLFGHAEETASLPPLRFQYSKFTPSHRSFRPISSLVGEPPSRGLEDPGLDLVDMLSESLPGVIQVDGPVTSLLV